MRGGCFPTCTFQKVVTLASTLVDWMSPTRGASRTNFLLWAFLMFSMLSAGRIACQLEKFIVCVSQHRLAVHSALFRPWDMKILCGRLKRYIASFVLLVTFDFVSWTKKFVIHEYICVCVCCSCKYDGHPPQLQRRTERFGHRFLWSSSSQSCGNCLGFVVSCIPKLSVGHCETLVLCVWDGCSCTSIAWGYCCNSELGYVCVLFCVATLFEFW